MGDICQSFEPMRDEIEIARAHDLMVAIAMGEVPSPFSDSGVSMERLQVATDVLCWVLRHNHNQEFADNLAKIEAWLKARGIVLELRAS